MALNAWPENGLSPSTCLNYFIHKISIECMSSRQTDINWTMSCYLNLEGVEQSARPNVMKLLIARVPMNENYSLGRTQLGNVIITSVWWLKLLWKKLLINKPVIMVIVIRLMFTDRRLRKIVAWQLFCFVLFYPESPRHLQWNLFINNQDSLRAYSILKRLDHRRILV